MSEEFWNNKISVGYYDKLHTSGLKKGEGFRLDGTTLHF